MTKIILTLFALALIVGQITNATIQCGRATSPSQDCCVGLQSLAKTAAASQPNHKDTCNCIKVAVQTFAMDYSKAKQLPQLCNYPSIIPIEPNLDCSK
ncbi:hypothetical protein H5410_050095 [Solanum commersonii]|uniref:Bifunctional inhibitor/plant lipid transfer protein/seed storage helical domain-containing protein n=1 Tax=Solanum commersonii TaxID=4109 RepID=A0A9J5WWL1_SOLCO|nr:hypothetical protein H5410_050095 [Solanum commersonii]